MVATKDISMYQVLTVLTASNQSAAQKRRVGILHSRIIDDRLLTEIQYQATGDRCRTHIVPTTLKQLTYVINNVLIDFPVSSQRAT